jgi:PAS domain S-box-containing protein
MTSGNQISDPKQFPCCPVTGLPITSKPEWAEIQLDFDYSVTFSIIGKAILLITPKGKPSDKGAKYLLEKREEVISDAGLSDKNYVELRDYRMLTAVPSKGGRMVVTNFLLKEQLKGQMLGFWVFGAPLIIRLMFQAGRQMHKSIIPVGVAKDYPEAIRKAVKVLRQSGVDVGSRIYPRTQKDEWAFEVEGYGASFELIGDDILYNISHGKLRENCVEQFIGLHQKVLDEAGLTQKGYFYRIANWERLESSTWKARRMYMAGLNAITKKTPSKLLVVFGLNKFMKTLVGVSTPFVSSPVLVANDLQDALEIIERERQRSTKTRAEGKIQKHPAKTYTEMQLNGFANEMLQVIGGISWDQAGVSLEGVDKNHPLKTVLDALAIIKLDLDNMLREKESSQTALHESEERYRTMFENTGTSMILVEEDMTISMANSEFMRNTGYSTDEIIGRMKWTEIVHPDDLGRMVEQHRLRREDPASTLPNYEFRYRTKSGDLRDALLTVDVIPGTRKSIASLIDITERNLAEEELKNTLNSLRKAVSMTIQVLVSAIEVRDPYTAGHQRRSANLARAIATEMGLPPEMVEGIRMAGYIHDIGKLSIPAEILSKPTKLSAIEFALIKEHSLRGYEILKDVESPWPLAEMIYQHHERLDGSGYPRKLQGNDIIIEARILAVADVVEAMASNRPYRPSLGIDPALAEIEKNRGTIYDDAVVDACIRLFREKSFELESA